MKLLVLYKARSEYRASVEGFIDDYKRNHPGSKVEVLDIDHREGIAIASLYDVFSFPAILALRNDGTLIQMWEGIDQLPRVDDVTAYMLDEF